MTEAHADHLRRAKAQDADAVRALSRAAYAKWVPLIGREPWPMTADYAAAIEAHIIDLLFAGDDLAALIEMIPHTDHLLIENVAVAPQFQGGGRGRALMAHAEEVASSLGLREIRLYTNQKFTGNVALYQKLGYRIDREEHLDIAVVIHMSKTIADCTAA